jgi:hypothetical protein
MRKARPSVLVLIVMAFSLFVSATAQEGDVLFLKGKRYFIYTNPLDGFLDNNPEKLPKSDVVSSSNWRGYVATWDVKDERLVLIDVTILRSVTTTSKKAFRTEPRSVMSDLFPGNTDVIATWFTGHVIVPDGKLVNYVHMGYASTYDKYIILRVEGGLVTRNWTANSAEFAKFRDAQFRAFKKTEQYRKAHAEATKEAGKGEGLSPKQNEEFLRQFYSEKYMSMVFDEPR